MIWKRSSILDSVKGLTCVGGSLFFESTWEFDFSTLSSRGERIIFFCSALEGLEKIVELLLQELKFRLLWNLLFGSVWNSQNLNHSSFFVLKLHSSSHYQACQGFRKHSSQEIESSYSILSKGENNWNGQDFSHVVSKWTWIFEFDLF